VPLQITHKQAASDKELERSLQVYIKMIMGEAFPVLHQVALGVTGRFV